MNPVTSHTDEQFATARNELELARRAAAADDSYVPRLVRAFRTMAELYLRSGQTSRAEGLLREAGFRLAEAKHPLPAETAAVTTSLAMLYDSLDRPEKAAEQYGRALAALESAGALTTRAGLTVCRACARLSLIRGEKMLAQKHLQKALQIAEMLGGDGGTDAAALREELKALGSTLPATAPRQDLPLPPPENPRPASPGAGPAAPRRFAAEAAPPAPPAPAPAPVPASHFTLVSPAPVPAPASVPVTIRVNTAAIAQAKPEQKPLQKPESAQPVLAEILREAAPAVATPRAEFPAPAPAPAPAPPARVTAPFPPPPPVRDLSVKRVTSPEPRQPAPLPPRNLAPSAPAPQTRTEASPSQERPRENAFRPLPIEIEPLTPILPVLSLFGEGQATSSNYPDIQPPVRAPRGRVGSAQGL